MAELILSSVGRAIGSRVAPAAFRAFAAQLGQAAGATLGRSIDQRLFGETRRIEGARMTDLHLQGSSEGASIPSLYGRVRIAGQVIWAARFKETTETTSVGGGKGGPPKVKSTSYRYSLSFAVGLCEGEIARIGRVWANGEQFDMSTVSWRLHTGAEDQAVDPLIEAIEGADAAPAYRGLAYVVFEDLPLENFGNVMPQFSFEIVRPAPSVEPGPRLEERIKSVCLIPGSGEFVYATEPVRRVIGPGQEAYENVHVERERANFLVALDQLAADLPNCETVMLVVAWFGDDLRCGHTEIRPGVEIASKETSPETWAAGGATRADAHVVSQVDGAPAYGGTPSDASVIAAITELKARGYRVGLYPFVLMDVASGNGLTDPYGGAEQAAYPWRGRITVSPAAGQPSSADQTSAAATQIADFFGSAAPTDFTISGDGVAYSGPAEYSYRRFILHNAKLAEAAGGVDIFIIGSEMRGLTTARSDATTFPAVSALQTLAGDVRSIVGGATQLTYAADWSEYFGHQPADGSGDVFFHLDPLWSDANIYAIGVDWYPPLTDWRDGETHADAAIADSIYDPDYLQARIESGEDFDWFYASDADRGTQIRTDITDGAYAEPWVFRAKDLRNFWSRQHFNRPGGVRDGSPTSWVPQSKPIWFTEFGVPAVDKGANAPNLFIDDKSSESALPPFSSGARDDLIQRRALEAYLRYWDASEGNNPTSSLYAAPMIDTGLMSLWCWDARPFPAFPARDDVWSDGSAWRRGHWFTGRAGLATLADVVSDICTAAGETSIDVSGLAGAVSGYVVDALVTARAALEPLMAIYDFDCVESAGQIVFFHRDAQSQTNITLAELAADSADDVYAGRGDGAETPIEVRVRFLDAERDYLIASASARRLDRAEGGVESLDAPLVMESEAAETAAQNLLALRRAGAETLRLALGPQHIALEPGDRVTLESGDAFEIERIEDAQTRALVLRRSAIAGARGVSAAEPASSADPILAPTPAFSILDLPPLPGSEDDDRPFAAIFASPWAGAHTLYAGADASALTARGEATQPAIMGETLWDFYSGPTDRWDEGNVVRIRLYGGSLSSASRASVLGGANAFAIENVNGEWEVLQAANAALVAENEYELSDFLRGQQGTAHAMGAPTLAGARIVKIDARLARLNIEAHEWGDPLLFVAPPSAALPSDARAGDETKTLPHASARPWAPAHVRGYRDGAGDIQLSWLRCASIGGDQWGPGDPPLLWAEAYQVEILNGSTPLRTLTAASAAATYTAAEQSADFGAPPANIRVRVAQLDQGGAPGLKSDLTITL